MKRNSYKLGIEVLSWTGVYNFFKEHFAKSPHMKNEHGERIFNILKMRDDGKTLSEIAQVCNLTRERIRQLEYHAVKLLRHPTRSYLIKNQRNMEI